MPQRRKTPKIVHKITNALTKTTPLTQIVKFSERHPATKIVPEYQSAIARERIFDFSVPSIKNKNNKNVCSCLSTPHHDKTFSIETVLKLATDGNNIKR